MYTCPECDEALDLSWKNLGETLECQCGEVLEIEAEYGEDYVIFLVHRVKKQ